MLIPASLDDALALELAASTPLSAAAAWAGHSGGDARSHLSLVPWLWPWFAGVGR